MNNSEKKPLKIFDSKVFWVVISILAALALWTYVTSTEGAVTERTLTGVKVEFLGADKLRESQGLLVTEQDTSTLSVTVSGARRVISTLSASNVTATINLNSVTTDGRYTVNYDLVYPADVNSSEITVVRSSTDVITFYVDKQVSKTVEVHGIFTGNTAEGYMAQETVSIDPLVVKISGPKAVVNLVDRAQVVVSREDVDKTLQYSSTYDLLDAEGNKVDDKSITRETEEVNVTLSVLSTKEIPLDITVIDGGGATREVNATVDIKPASVVLAGEPSVIDALTKINIGTVDLRDFTTDYSGTFSIIPPNDTENLTGINEASVSITLSGVQVRNFTVRSENISCTNVPEGYNASIITRTLSVVLRGSVEDLDEIKMNNLRAVADFTELNISSVGVYNPEITVYVDGFPNVGAVLENRIYVDITRK